MSQTVPTFHAYLEKMGTDVTFHREEGGAPCICLTREGFRSARWHAQAPKVVASTVAGQNWGGVSGLQKYRVVFVLASGVWVEWTGDGEITVNNGQPAPVITIPAGPAGVTERRLFRRAPSGSGSDNWYQVTGGVFAGALETTFTDTAGTVILGTPITPAVVCNEEGRLTPVVTEKVVRAAIQPATIGQRGRSAERVTDLLGSIEQDDHFGIFPCTWQGTTLDFRDWGEAGEDYILYDGRRFNVVAADKIPDIDGDPNHHWEVGLRVMKLARAA